MVMYSRFHHWFLSHVRAVRFACNELCHSPITSIITVFVLGIAMALPVGFFILLEDAQRIDNHWNTSSPTISLYLKSSATHTQINTLMQALQKNKKIQKIDYISPAEGLAAFEKNSPFANIVKLFQNNPIPAVITLLPIKQAQNPSEINALYLSVKQLPLVDIAQLDIHWVTRLYDVIDVGKKMAKALFVLFGLSVILIIAHTLHASLAKHINEIQVLRLIGATPAYIRRPLLYRGMLYGLLGGIIAWVLVNLFMMQLQPPVSQLAETYHTIFHLRRISFLHGLTLLTIAALLGLISAWLISTQFLNLPEQTD